MSMAGNPSMTLDFAVNTAMLDRALNEADRRIQQATKGTGNAIDRLMDTYGAGIARKLQQAIGAGFAMSVVDNALRKVAEGIRSGQGADEIGMAIAESIGESLKSIPVAGPLGDILATVLDPLMGGALGDDEARRKTMEFYKRQAEGEEALRQIRLRSGSEEEAIAEWKRQEIEKLNDLNKKSQDEAYQYEERLNQKAYDAAVERARTDPQRLAGLGAAFGPSGAYAAAQGAMLGGPSQADFMDRFQTEESKQRQKEISRAYTEAVKAISAEADKKLADAQAKRDAEAKRRQDEFAREQEKARVEQERMLKEQEAAYDRFIQGNAQDALRIIETQIASLTAGTAPTRSERLAGMMQDFGTMTADTALGAFTYSLGDAATVSQSILANAEAQLATLERIEDLQAEANRIAEESGLR